MKSIFGNCLGASGVLLATILAPASFAQTKNALMEEVVVTATKKNVVENVQDVPMSISAFSEAQLEALKFKDISDLAFSVPNANLQPASTQGTAFFGIRGAVAVSTVLSVDPSVGVFLDGVYQPTSNGIVLDNFDLESIEILRGPQGVLFGRNVVGGAIVVNTTKPSHTFSADFGYRVESGFRGTGEDSTFTGVVTGPLSDTVAGKLAVYINDNGGWFENEFNGEDYGANEVSIVRTAASWQPTSTLEFTLQYENFSQDGDGLAVQSHDRIPGREDTRPDGSPGLFPRGSQRVSTEMETFARTDSEAVTFTTTLDVGFGNGTITNIFGWKSLEQSFLADIDGTPIATFPAFVGVEVDHYSNELRYYGSFGDYELTTGLYYLNAELVSEENQSLRPAPNFWINRTGGGFQDSETVGVFANLDYQITDSLTLQGGLRYSAEEKSARSHALNGNRAIAATQSFFACGYVVGDHTCVLDLVDSDDWSNVSFRFGATYVIDEAALVYGSVSSSYRAGGYNLRRTDIADDRDSVDEERMDQIELGAKLDVSDRFRLNSAVFMIEASDLQRTTFVPATLSQKVDNVASSRVFGVEIESILSLTESLSATLTMGIMQGEYTEVLTDLNDDGVVDAEDQRLELPNTPDYMYTFSLLHDTNIGKYELNSRLMFSHREERFSGSNTHITPEMDVVDASIGLRPNAGSWQLSLYGRNLTNESIYTQSTDIPLPDGAHWAGLLPGRRYGLEFKYEI